MRCDLSLKVCICSSDKFQSLLGFLMRCDIVVWSEFINRERVSIPAGFSDALRPYEIGKRVTAMGQFQSLLGFLMRCDGSSSIVIQFSLRFQSLLGFLMRCDVYQMQESERSYGVSIPAGFSDALRLSESNDLPCSFILFQSLLGFLMRCDIGITRSGDLTHFRFNPCWVF